MWLNNETFEAPVRIAQFSAGTLCDAEPRWSMKRVDGTLVANGKLPKQDIPLGNEQVLGKISQSLSGMKAAGQMIVTVELPGTEWRNSWSIWVYPEQVSIDAGSIVVCRKADEALAALAKGEAVVLAPSSKDIKTAGVASCATIFWNSAWFPGKKRQDHIAQDFRSSLLYDRLSSCPS